MVALHADRRTCGGHVPSRQLRGWHAALVKCVKSGVGIRLQYALEAGEMGSRMHAFAVGAIGEPYRRRRGVAAGTVVTKIGSQPCRFGLAVAPRKHRDRRVVGVQLGRRQHRILGRQIRTDALREAPNRD